MLLLKKVSEQFIELLSGQVFSVDLKSFKGAVIREFQKHFSFLNIIQILGAVSDSGKHIGLPAVFIIFLAPLVVCLFNTWTLRFLYNKSFYQKLVFCFQEFVQNYYSHKFRCLTFF